MATLKVLGGILLTHCDGWPSRWRENFAVRLVVSSFRCYVTFLYVPSSTLRSSHYLYQYSLCCRYDNNSLLQFLIRTVLLFTMFQIPLCSTTTVTTSTIYIHHHHHHQQQQHLQQHHQQQRISGWAWSWLLSLRLSLWLRPTLLLRVRLWLRLRN